MSVSIRAVNTETKPASTGATVNFPTFAAGDLMLSLWAMSPSAGPVVDTPIGSGWIVRNNFSASQVGTYLFARWMDGTEGSSQAFTGAPSSSAKCIWTASIIGADPYRGIQFVQTRNTLGTSPPQSPSLSMPEGAEQALWLASAAIGQNASPDIQLTAGPASADSSDLIYNTAVSGATRTALGVARRIATIASWAPEAWSVSNTADDSVVTNRIIYPAVTHGHPNLLVYNPVTHITATLGSPEDFAITIPAGTKSLWIWVSGGSGTTLTLDPSGANLSLTNVAERIVSPESCHWFKLSSPPIGTYNLRVTATGGSTVSKVLTILPIDSDFDYSSLTVTSVTSALSGTPSLPANNLFLAGMCQGHGGDSADLTNRWTTATLNGVELRGTENRHSLTTNGCYSSVFIGRTMAGGSQAFAATSAVSGETHTGILLSLSTNIGTLSETFPAMTESTISVISSGFPLYFGAS